MSRCSRISSRSSLWLRSGAVLGALVAAACSDASYRLGGSSHESVSHDASPHSGLCANGADLEFIDQMEDGNGSIDFTNGRAGVWFAFNDETGTQFPGRNLEGFPMSALDAPRARSRYAAHSYGSGFHKWGSGIGFDMRAQQPYDAAAYAGIAFWARRAPGATAAVRFAVPDDATSPLGGKCDSDAGLCHDDFGSDLDLGPEFRFFSFTWRALSQRGWSGNVERAIDASQIYGVRFQLEVDVDFDFWIDDVALLCHD